MRERKKMLLSLKDDQKCRRDDTLWLFKIIISELGGTKKNRESEIFLFVYDGSNHNTSHMTIQTQQVVANIAKS